MFSFFYSLESGWILGHGFNDAIFRTFCAVGMILLLIYVFKTYFNQSNKLTKTLSRASFPAYVFQFVFLITCFAFLKSFYISWSPWLITLSTGVISVLSSFMLGIVLYRLPFLEEFFNGNYVQQISFFVSKCISILLKKKRTLWVRFLILL